MKFRGTLILLIIAALLAGYILFVESKEPSEEERFLAEKRVFTFSFPSVQKAVIKNNSGTIVLEKNGVEWNIIEPFGYPGDLAQINKFLFDIEFSPALRTIKPDPELKKELGLDSAEISILVESHKGIQEIIFGKTAGAGDIAYAYDTSRDIIFVVESALLKKINSISPDLFRNRNLIRFFTTHTGLISITSGNNISEFSNVDSRWKITKPFNSSCNPEKFSELTKALSDIRILEFIEPSSLPEGIFENPAAVIKTQGRDSSWTHEFIFSRKRDSGTKTYVLQKSLKTACLVDASCLDSIIIDPENFRNLRLANEELVKASSIKILTGDKKISLVCINNEWKLTEPIRHPADFENVLRYIHSFITTKAAGTIPFNTEKFTSPAAIVKFGYGKSSWPIEFFKAKENLYAKTKMDNNLLCLDKNPQSSFFDFKYLRFVSRKLLQFPLTDISAINIRKNGDLYIYKKDAENKWQGQEKSAGPETINNLLWLLMEEKAKSVFSDNVTALSENGLANPEITITLTGKDASLKLHIGNQKENSYFAANEEGKFIYLISPKIPEAVEKILTHASHKLPAAEL